MTFIGGKGASHFIDTDGDAVYEDFGPFDIGPNCDWVRGGNTTDIR